jgi:hypothetical protein
VALNARAVVVALIVAVAGAAPAGCASGPPAARGPRWSLRLPALDGGEIDLAELRGRVVVVHVFETGSAPAMRDVEQFLALHRREPRRVALVGVAIDPAGFPVVAPWRSALGIRYLIGLGEARGGGPGLLGTIGSIPTTIVLDREGREVSRAAHPLAGGELTRMVDPLLE